MQEVVFPGATGCLHEFLDVIRFAASIADLHRNRMKLEQMSEAARQIARKNLTFGGAFWATRIYMHGGENYADHGQNA